MTEGFALFDTAIGLCGVAWNARGLAGVMLPLSEGGDPRGRMTRRHPEADEGEPPPAVAEAIAGMQAVLRGEKRDLLEVALDDGAIAPLAKRVYAIASAICEPVFSDRMARPARESSRLISPTAPAMTKAQQSTKKPRP